MTNASPAAIAAAELAEKRSNFGETLAAFAIGEFLATVDVDDSGITESPRDYENLGVMYCEYALGDSDKTSDSFAAVADAVREWCERGYPLHHFPRYLQLSLGTKVVLPMYGYDHGSFAVSTESFAHIDPQGWDSGVLGFVCDTADSRAGIGIPDDTADDEISRILTQEVETYSAYLQGSVYGWTVSRVSICDLGHVHVDPVDSCHGYIVSDKESREEVIGDARESASYHSEHDTPDTTTAGGDDR